MSSKLPPAPVLPDPFAFRQDESYRRNLIKRAPAHSHWKFDMNTTTRSAAPAPNPQEQTRINVQDAVTSILMKAEGAKDNALLIPRFVKQVMDHIEREAGPFSGIVDNVIAWEQMVLAGLKKAEGNLETATEAEGILGLNNAVRDAFEQFEMSNLSLEDYQAYVARKVQARQERRTQQLMESHPGFKPGITAINATPRVSVVREGDADFRAPLGASSSTPATATSDQSNMQNPTNTNGANVHISHNDGRPGTTIHIDAAQAGGNETLADRLGAAATATRKKVQIRLDDIKPTGRVKQALKYTVGAVATAAVGYCVYRAYKAGVFGAAARVVTEGIPAAGAAIADSAELVPTVTESVTAFFRR